MERAGTRSGESRYSCRVLLPGGKLTRRSSAEMAPNGWERWGCVKAGDGCLTPTHIHLLLHLSCFQTSFPSKTQFISLWPSLGSEAWGCRGSVFTFIFKSTCVNSMQWVSGGTASLNNWFYRCLLNTSNGSQTKIPLLSWTITQKLISGLFFQDSQDIQKMNSPISVSYFNTVNEKINTMVSQ